MFIEITHLTLAYASLLSATDSHDKDYLTLPIVHSINRTFSQSYIRSINQSFNQSSKQASDIVLSLRGDSN